MEKSKWKAISLFAGAGGCDLGFCQAGINIIAAFDNSDAAITTYNKNFIKSKCYKEDLSTCSFEQIRHRFNMRQGELDLMIGGPPCQGFTSAGIRFGKDPRNKLIKRFAQALKIFLPRWFMLENVEGILTTSAGEYLIEYVKNMIMLGYTIYIKKVYMQEYGVPQRRKRVIIVGNREGKRFIFPKATHNDYGAISRHTDITLKQAISDLEDGEISSIDHIFKKESPLQLERISALACGQSMKDLPKHLQHQSFKRRANRRVCDGMPSEKRGGAPSGLKRLFYDEPCLTITSAATSEFIHPIQDRMLTIRECARVQTFPDNFMFYGTDAQKMVQIGNAIPPVFAKKIAEQIQVCDEQFLAGTETACLVEFSLTKASAMSPALQKTVSMLQEFTRQDSSQLCLEGLLCQ